jgi:hypothetical protein
MRPSRRHCDGTQDSLANSHVLKMVLFPCRVGRIPIGRSGIVSGIRSAAALGQILTAVRLTGSVT